MKMGKYLKQQESDSNLHNFILHFKTLQIYIYNVEKNLTNIFDIVYFVRPQSYFLRRRLF